MKVLYFIDSLGMGGIQRLVEKWALYLRKKNIEVEFLILEYGEKSSIEKNLLSNNFKIYKISNINFNNPLSFIGYGKKLNSFFENHNDYCAVHLHTSSKNFQVLKYAKKYNIPVRIIHSHSSDFKTNNIIKKLVGNIFKIPMKKYATHFFACSDSAGKWLYDTNILESDKYYLIKNSIDYKQFIINVDTRKKIRKQLNVADDCIIFGQIGRLSEVKNHKFSIEMFEKYHTYNNNSILLFLGDGELRNSLEKIVNTKKMQNSIIFMGDIDNVNEYLQGIDIVLLPSLYEGLPMILVEAQASGTKCLVSENVSKNAKFTDDIIFLPIDDINIWVENAKQVDITKNDNTKKVIENGFSVDDTIDELIRVYKG